MLRELTRYVQICTLGISIHFSSVFLVKTKDRFKRGEGAVDPFGPQSRPPADAGHPERSKNVTPVPYSGLKIDFKK